MDSLERLQDALHSMTFSRRRYLYRELQIRASNRNDLERGTIVTWPDVLLFLTPAIIDAAIEAAQNVTPAELQARSWQ